MYGREISEEGPKIEGTYLTLARFSRMILGSDTISFKYKALITGTNSQWHWNDLRNPRMFFLFAEFRFLRSFWHPRGRLQLNISLFTVLRPFERKVQISKIPRTTPLDLPPRHLKTNFRGYWFWNDPQISNNNHSTYRKINSILIIRYEHARSISVAHTSRMCGNTRCPPGDLVFRDLPNHKSSLCSVYFFRQLFGNFCVIRGEHARISLLIWLALACGWD